MIRKQRKAQWLYVCPTCDYTSGISTDLFGAQENQLHHERSLAHVFKVIAQAFRPVVDAYAQLARTLGPVAEQMQKDYALLPPPNLPHDPSLLRDRRKWGGR